VPGLAVLGFQSRQPSGVEIGGEEMSRHRAGKSARAEKDRSVEGSRHCGRLTMTQPETSHSGQSNRRGAAMVVAAAMLVGIAWSVGIDVQDRFFTRRQEIIMNRYATESDPMIAQAAAGGGLYIRFIGFSGRVGGYASNLYFRANYILFPQRVLVGDPSAAINTPDQIVAANFVPDNSWLVSHNVPTILTYFYRDGVLNAQVQPAATTR
jgi:hypothetical protein